MKKILIVEDDRKITLAMCARLDAQGYEVLSALNAEDGLRMAIELRPDLLIMDISLPARNGLDLAAQLRSLPMTSGIKMIFMTAFHSILGFRTRALELGAVAFIEKPFKDGELLAEVLKALGDGERLKIEPSVTPVESVVPRPAGAVAEMVNRDRNRSRL